MYQTCSFVCKVEEFKPTEMLNDGMNYYSKNIIRALSPYATADAGIVSMVLRNFADDIEKNNPGAKELRIWVENNSTKPELKEEIKVMCVLKDIFFGDEEVKYKYSSKKFRYVNGVEGWMYLWRPIGYEIDELIKRVMNL